ncbi:MAG: M48 family metalloprotease [Gammaproteobacteria bacterium]
MRGAAQGVFCFLCAALLASAPLVHAQCKSLWPVEELAQVHARVVELRSKRGVAARIPRDWLRALRITAARLDAAAGISTSLYLCDARAPNAFAWREGGANNVAVTLGMRTLIGNDWHAFAALLGHENAHLVKNHGARRQQRALGLALGESILKTLLSDGGAPPAVFGIDLLGAGAAVIGASYSREEEHEADAVGMRYAHCAGFAVEGALTLHRKLGGASDFLSGHPSSAKRIRALRGELARARAAGCE